MAITRLAQIKKRLEKLEEITAAKEETIYIWHEPGEHGEPEFGSGRPPEELYQAIPWIHLTVQPGS